MPRAEILLATYNGERYLMEQIDSLLCQSWPDWHITISDDSSTDCTPCIIEEYATRYPQKITWIKHGKRFGNARDHFFYLMQRCKEDYMLFCDQDDIWHPDKVEITMNALLAAERRHGNQMPVLVFTDQTPVDEHLKPIASSLMKMQKQNASVIDYRRLLLQNIVTGCVTGINQSLAGLAAQCRNPQHTVMHDWWLGLVAAKFGKVVYIDQSTMLYRQHGKNSVGAKKVNSLGYVFQKLANLGRLRNQIKKKKEQAICFAETYADKLDLIDNAFLKQYALSHSGFTFYFRNRHLINGFLWFVGFVVLG